MNARPMLVVCALTGVLVGPALAQYKVIDADGRVTYTDRPAATDSSKVTSMRRGGTAAATATAPSLDWPLELRQAVSRFPVTLYAGPACSPCDRGRQMLLQRGVPFAEKRVTTDEDAAALERITGGRTLPSLMVGSQPLRGLSPDDWISYLDAAAYPRESRLPKGWQPAAATPLVQREATASATAASGAAPAPARPAPAAAPATPAAPAAAAAEGDDDASPAPPTPRPSPIRF